MQTFQKIVLLWIALAVTGLVSIFAWYAASKPSQVYSTGVTPNTTSVSYKNGSFYWVTFVVTENSDNQLQVEKLVKFVDPAYKVNVVAYPSYVELNLALQNSSTSVKTIQIDSGHNIHGFWELWFMFESIPTNPITLFFNHKALNGNSTSSSVKEQS